MVIISKLFVILHNSRENDYMNWILTLSLILFLSCNNEPCKNEALNSPKCDQCPAGKMYMEGQCALLVTPPPPKDMVDDPSGHTK
jgi:hypothetical protein